MRNGLEIASHHTARETQLACRMKGKRTTVILNWNFSFASLYFTYYKCISLIHKSLCFADFLRHNHSVQSYSIVKAYKAFLNQERTGRREVDLKF